METRNQAQSGVAAVTDNAETIRFIDMRTYHTLANGIAFTIAKACEVHSTRCVDATLVSDVCQEFTARRLDPPEVEMIAGFAVNVLAHRHDITTID